MLKDIVINSSLSDELYEAIRYSSGFSDENLSAFVTLTAYCSLLNTMQSWLLEKATLTLQAMVRIDQLFAEAIKIEHLIEEIGRDNPLEAPFWAKKSVNIAQTPEQMLKAAQRLQLIRELTIGANEVIELEEMSPVIANFWNPYATALKRLEEQCTEYLKACEEKIQNFSLEVVDGEKVTIYTFEYDTNDELARVRQFPRLGYRCQDVELKPVPSMQEYKDEAGFTTTVWIGGEETSSLDSEPPY